jgi:regulator of protease activity HflC (stomatin/prohibitin superfamily)
MLTVIVLVFSVLVAGMILVAGFKLPGRAPKSAAAALALAVLILGFLGASVRYVSSSEVGIIYKNVGASQLKEGAFIAVDGETGVQADVLAPGWHLGYFPIMFDVSSVPLTEVPTGMVGVLEVKDGRPLAEGQVIADEWEPATFQKMLDARYFLTTGKGQKGTQASVLTPGKYRLNTELFKVLMVKQLDVDAGTVAVLKSNFGGPPSVTINGPEEIGQLQLAAQGERGVIENALPPGKYPINPEALKTYVVSTETRVAHYTTTERINSGDTPLGAITVKSLDGFTFPVDVRVVYFIKATDAPKVVALLGGDNSKLQDLLTSRVRAIFRDSAQDVRALDYTQQRSRQGETALTKLGSAMKPYGVSIEAVDIGEVGDEKTLGDLLKTQRDREIAKQEQMTLKEQQLAAEQQKELARIEQEAEEEKRLATASYDVKIAEQNKEKVLIAAQAEAQAISVHAEAQAKAYESIALQIGRGNAALIELLKIVGERGIQITPRVMVTGGTRNGVAGGNAETTALIGTMLDSMMEKSPEPAAKP